MTHAADLHAFVEQASETAEVLFRPDGQMLAYFLAENRRGERTLIACPMAGTDDETAFRIGMPQQLRRGGFVRWCFFTEAWMASYGPGEQPADGTMPEKRADRIEVVSFLGEIAATGETLFASRQIWREANAPAKLMPLVFARERTQFVMDENRSAGSCQ